MPLTRPHTLTNDECSRARGLIRLAAPLMGCNLLQQLYATIDLMVVGRFASQDAFAAVGVAGTVSNLWLFAIVGACAGISVVFSQLEGAGDAAAFRREHHLCATWGFVASVGLTAAALACVTPMMTLCCVPAEIQGLVTSYLWVSLLALPASYLYNLYAGILRSVGRTTAILAILAATVAANLALDLLLIAQLGWGVRGAAVATLVAQIASAALGHLYLRKRCPKLMPGKADHVTDRSLASTTLRFSLIMGFQQASLYLGKLLVQGAVNTAGVDAIAAYAAATRIESFANSFGDSGASATSVLVAQAVGARDEARVAQTTRASFWVLGSMGLANAAVLCLAAQPLCALVLGQASDGALDAAAAYLAVVGAFYPLCFLGNTYAGYFDGTGRMQVSFAGTASHIMMRVVLSWLLIGRFGLTLVAVATGLGWLYVNVFWWIVRRRSHRQLPVTALQGV